MSDEWESLDPWEGAERPAPRFLLSELPPIDAVYKRRRTFEAYYYGVSDGSGSFQRGDAMSAKQARVFIESELTFLKATLHRARFHPAKDCWFTIPPTYQEKYGNR